MNRNQRLRESATKKTTSALTKPWAIAADIWWQGWELRFFSPATCKRRQSAGICWNWYRYIVIDYLIYKSVERNFTTLYCTSFASRWRSPQAIQIADENVINNGTVTESLDENSSWALDIHVYIPVHCSCTYMYVHVRMGTRIRIQNSVLSKGFINMYDLLYMYSENKIIKYICSNWRTLIWHYHFDDVCWSPNVVLIIAWKGHAFQQGGKTRQLKRCIDKIRFE